MGLGSHWGLREGESASPTEAACRTASRTSSFWMNASSRATVSGRSRSGTTWTGLGGGRGGNGRSGRGPTRKINRVTTHCGKRDRSARSSDSPSNCKVLAQAGDRVCMVRSPRRSRAGRAFSATRCGTLLHQYAFSAISSRSWGARPGMTRATTPATPSMPPLRRFAIAAVRQHTPPEIGAIGVDRLGSARASLDRPPP